MNPTPRLRIRHRRSGAGRRPAAGAPLARQRGVVLFTSLILLLILTMVGVMLSRMQTVEEQISANDQDHQLAVQAAEATLRYAEEELGTASENSADCPLDTNGMYQWVSGVEDYYLQYQLGSAPANAFLTYGGPALPVLGTPVFLIECMPPVELPGNGPMHVYRITAYSYGGDSNTFAELQEIRWEPN